MLSFSIMLSWFKAYFVSLLLGTVLIVTSSLYQTSAEWNTRDYFRREHSLIKPYADTFWDIIGNTLMTGNYIRLTSNEKSQQGAIWNNVPVTYRDWEVSLQFKVHGTKGDLFGDGFAFWYTRDHGKLGPVFGSKDEFKGLGLFFDTYNNHNGQHDHGHPYISAMVNNGSLRYDHDTDGTHTQIAGCEAQFRNKPHDTYVAIRYSENTLKVSMDIDGKSGWNPCMIVSNVILPTRYYIGISAATGDLSDIHDVLGVKFYELEVSRKDDPTINTDRLEPYAANMEPPREHKDNVDTVQPMGWRWFFTILFILVCIGVIGFAGHYFYTKRMFDRKKRFY